MNGQESRGEPAATPAAGGGARALTVVRLDWAVEDSRLSGVRVPVAVRTATLALYKQAEMPGTVELPPGTYVVTAKMPAGQELIRVVKVGREAMRVEMTPEDSPLSAALEYLASPRERRAAVRAAVAAARHVGKGLVREALDEERPDGDPVDARGAVARGLATIVRRLGSLLLPDPEEVFGPTVAGPVLVPRGATAEASARPQPDSPLGWLRGFAADPLRGTSEPVGLALALVERGDDVAEYRVGPAAALRYVQAVQPGRPTVNIALPTSAQAGCRVVVRREPDRYWIEVHLEHAEANLLLGYQRNAAPHEEAVTAERLLAGKLDDPIAAALGAYTLLRFGDLERLHGWPANLRSWFPWLPDGAALHGEQLARQGDHDAALAAFLDAAGRGLPVWSDGIDYLSRRLELYAGARQDFSAADMERAEGVLARLRPLVSRVDFSHPITTLGGLDPARPDARPFTGPPPAGALDLAAVFG